MKKLKGHPHPVGAGVRQQRPLRGHDRRLLFPDVVGNKLFQSYQNIAASLRAAIITGQLFADYSTTTKRRFIVD